MNKDCRHNLTTINKRVAAQGSTPIYTRLYRRRHLRILRQKRSLRQRLPVCYFQKAIQKVKTLEEKLKKRRSHNKAQANTIVKGLKTQLDSDSINSGSDSVGSVLETYLCDVNSCKLEMNSLDKQSSTWILDLGATHHVTGDSRLLCGLRTYTRIGPMLAAGGESHNVVGKGHIQVKLSDGKIKQFKNVLYVAGIRRNLLSVGYIADQPSGLHSQLRQYPCHNSCEKNWRYPL
jgi:hypothetical protein